MSSGKVNVEAASKYVDSAKESLQTILNVKLSPMKNRVSDAKKEYEAIMQYNGQIITEGDKKYKVEIDDGGDKQNLEDILRYIGYMEDNLKGMEIQYGKMLECLEEIDDLKKETGEALDDSENPDLGDEGEDFFSDDGEYGDGNYGGGDSGGGYSGDQDYGDEGLDGIAEGVDSDVAESTGGAGGSSGSGGGSGESSTKSSYTPHYQSLAEVPDVSSTVSSAIDTLTNSSNSNSSSSRTPVYNSLEKVPNTSSISSSIGSGIAGSVGGLTTGLATSSSLSKSDDDNKSSNSYRPNYSSIGSSYGSSVASDISSTVDKVAVDVPLEEDLHEMPSTDYGTAVNSNGGVQITEKPADVKKGSGASIAATLFGIGAAGGIITKKVKDDKDKKEEDNYDENFNEDGIEELSDFEEEL